MPKLKTHRGAAKRFKAAANGFKCKQSHLRHILSKKSSKRKRHLRGKNFVDNADIKAVAAMLKVKIFAKRKGA